ncbi:MAG: esterase-like activity of phytase family protein [Flavobacterium sp.]|nr:esterase-like activity of phytase family protein [Flavobacterium sp.]
MKGVLVICLSVLLFACAAIKNSQQQPTVSSIAALKLLGEIDVPHNLQFKNTTIGGLSGIDYDSANNLYYLICDDRSSINAARLYTAKLFTSTKGIDSVAFVDVTFLHQQNGALYPNNKQNPSKTPDPEAIRYNAVTKQLIWTSEGERIVKPNDTVLANPAITTITTNGKYIDTFKLPLQLIMQATNKGPRQNGVLEGLTFTNNYKQLYVNVEEPLYEDGLRAMLTDTTAWIRIFKYDVTTKKQLKQYAYKLDPIAYAATPADAFKINGVPDILSIGNNKLLVMERSFSTGRLPCTIKIYEADLNGATNIRNNPSLQHRTKFTPASKRLILNLDSLGVFTDNVEGMTFGPTLPNGHRTLVFVADNNFAVFEKTQFFLFEIVP